MHLSVRTGGILIFSYPFFVAGITWEKKDPHARDLGTIKRSSVRVRPAFKACGRDRDGEGRGKYTGRQRSLYVETTKLFFDILAGYTTVPTLLGFVAKRR